ncbi:MAG: hypothetical protein IT317_03300 [Anaerolineales bacterium]|nr:hypothetical protein [Anaerolineales bacterium]
MSASKVLAYKFASICFVVSIMLMASAHPVAAQSLTIPNVAPPTCTEPTTELLSPVRISLNAERGASVTQDVRALARTVDCDGTVTMGYTTVSFTLVNTNSAPMGDLKAAGLARPAAVMTWADCFGVLNGANANHTSKASWHYDGTTAWRDGTAESYTYVYYPWYRYGFSGSGSSSSGGSTVGAWTGLELRFSLWFAQKFYDIFYTLGGNGSCSATGSIS